jgi:hypothetical protein
MMTSDLYMLVRSSDECSYEEVELYQSVEGAINSLLKREEFMYLDIKTHYNKKYPEVIDIVYWWSFHKKDGYAFKSEYSLYPACVGD